MGSMQFCTNICSAFLGTSAWTQAQKEENLTHFHWPVETFHIWALYPWQNGTFPIGLSIHTIQSSYVELYLVIFKMTLAGQLSGLGIWLQSQWL